MPSGSVLNASIVILGNMGVYVAILCGLIGGCAIGYFTEYYTSDTYKPTQELAAASETGSATIIIGGISLGLKSTMTSILIVAVAVPVSSCKILLLPSDLSYGVILAQKL